MPLRTPVQPRSWRNAAASGLLALLIQPLACADLTAPTATSAPTPATAGTQTAAAAAPPPSPTAAASARPNTERITASHVLIAYAGATRARPEVTRSKEEAQKLAQQVAQRAKGGNDFKQLALEFSDDPTAKSQNGSLGTFDRHSMVRPFSDAAFALKPGEVSGVVETQFGFHVIRRDQ